MCGYEFRWDMTRALEVALYRTYCVPSISALLDRTGEIYRRTQKRYDDTALIVAEISKWGYESERGREAIRRMNRAHSRFDISNADYLYVLSKFIFEPIRSIERFGWRNLTTNEKLASYYFWHAVGLRMGIKEIPENYEKFRKFASDYERHYFRFAETNQRVGSATRDLFCLVDAACLDAACSIGNLRPSHRCHAGVVWLPTPNHFDAEISQWSAENGGWIVRMLPARKTPNFFTNRANRTYPHRYEIANLGPPDLDRQRST